MTGPSLKWGPAGDFSNRLAIICRILGYGLRSPSPNWIRPVMDRRIAVVDRNGDGYGSNPYKNDQMSKKITHFLFDQRAQRYVQCKM